jgi:CubicO group peptidase (beta-lactamase class C family)
MTTLSPDPRSATRDVVAALPELIEHAMAVSATPGLNIAIAHRGELVYEDAFGHADLAAGTPMRTDTVTQSGSITKLYTAVALMQLVEQGRADVYAPVNRYLTDVRLVNPLGERDITIYDLLTFRSGLATDTNYAQLYAPRPLGDFLADELAATSQPGYDRHLARWCAKVGERWEYSNLGLAIAGRLVELLNGDGLSFGAYVEAHILAPLGMRSSLAPAVQDAAHAGQELLDRRSTGYALFGRTHVPAPLVQSPLTPAVGLLTTPGDHIRLLMALLGGGRHGDARILAPETVRFMLSPHVTVGTDQLDCRHNGIVFELGKWGTRTAHFGRTGVHTFGWLNLGRGYPHLDLAICVFTNRWDIRRWYNPDATMAPGAIAQFVAARMAAPGDGGMPVRAPRTRAWKTSYAIGLAVVERLAGLLELDAGTIPATVRLMADGAREQAGAGEWDADGFSHGVADMLGVPMAPEAIRRVLASDHLAVSPEDLRLVWLGFSGRAQVPMPVGHWADAEHVARPRPAA